MSHLVASYHVPLHLSVISQINNNSATKNIPTTIARRSLQFISNSPVSELGRTSTQRRISFFLTHISRVFTNAATSMAERYRIIKRSHSFVRDDKTLMPHTKRQKIHAEAHAHDRIFASRTASLRRADSLKSVQVGDGKACIIIYKFFSLAAMMIMIVIFQDTYSRRMHTNGSSHACSRPKES